MDEQEQIEILNALRRSQQTFLDAVDGITEDVAAKRPGPDRWSALECVEHLAVSEDFLLSRITQAEQAGDMFSFSSIFPVGTIWTGLDRGSHRVIGPIAAPNMDL
jgi:hypothetical protein